MATLQANGKILFQVQRSSSLDKETATYTRALMSNGKVLEKWKCTTTPTQWELDLYEENKDKGWGYKDPRKKTHNWPWKHTGRKLLPNFTATQWVQYMEKKGWTKCN